MDNKEESRDAESVAVSESGTSISEFQADSGCSTLTDPCCRPTLQPNDPEYLNPPKLGQECKVSTAVEKFEETSRKRAYIEDILAKHMAGELKTGPQPKDPEAVLKEYYNNHVETTESLDFLKSHPEYKVSGPNPMRIPHDQLQKAMDGFSNMQLAHEICINHDFRLERFEPQDTNLEGRIRIMMKKAYWDTFDEALNQTNSRHQRALSVFREMKEMLLELLLPHNKGIKAKIRDFLDDKIIVKELRLKIFDIRKYSDFIIGILGQLCCPVRDKQITALKMLVKPSEIFRGIIEIIEAMQLDMANFLISQIRPTIMSNCIHYERLKFAHFIELEYQLHEDALRVTRSWILRHRVPNRADEIIIGHAFAEILMWTEKEWPETLTLDWARYCGLAEETKRVSILGAVVLGGFNAARSAFHEDDASITGLEQSNMFLLSSYRIRDKLRADASILLTKDDIRADKLQETLERVAEQGAKITNDSLLELHGKQISEDQKNTIRLAITDVAREDHPVRLLLIRKLQEFVSNVIAYGKKMQTELPKALTGIQDEVLAICIELNRIAQHNRAVFQDLYAAMIADQSPAPKFMNEYNGEVDPIIKQTIHLLQNESTKQLKITRAAREEQLEDYLDESGNLKKELEDGPVVETTPEIEAMIDKIIEETEFVDDYDEFANITGRQAVEMLAKLKRHDNATIEKQMRKEEEARLRIQEKKDKMRVQLRVAIREDMGLPLYNKLNKKPEYKKYCKLLKVMLAEEAKKRNEPEPKKEKEAADPSIHDEDEAEN